MDMLLNITMIAGLYIICGPLIATIIVLLILMGK